MISVSVNIPDAVIYDTKMNQNTTEQYIRRIVALTYYTKNGVSLGYCAEIAGMTKTDFIKFLGENQISVFHFNDENELTEDIINA